MKFLVDAQLPRRVAQWLQQAGHDAIHTLDLPHGNGTPDGEVSTVAVRENRVVVTKDADFVNTFLLTGCPERLLLISTGYITNNHLEALLVPNLTAILSALQAQRFDELTRTTLIVHF